MVLNYMGSELVRIVTKPNYTKCIKPKRTIHVVEYARVSSKKQEDNLSRQMNNLDTY